jgi:signal transduction histidine kinase
VELAGRAGWTWQAGGGSRLHLASTWTPALQAAFAGYVDEVIRTVTARWAPGPAGRQLLPVITAVRTLVLIVVLITVPLAEPRPGVGDGGVVMAVALAVVAISWIACIITGRSGHANVAAMAVMGVAGGVMAGLSPLSTSVAVGCVVVSAAGVRLSTETSMAVTAGTVAAFLATGLVASAPVETLVGYPLGFVGLWAFGLTRHAYVLRAEQAERTLAEAQRAHEAETHAAALTERARIAREIHDVLAHSLAAVSVNLQAAEGLLGSLPPGSPELARAIECIGRAGAFTREGLADARRAILALRDDAAPLAEQLSALAQEWQADGDARVGFSVTGSPRPVAADITLAAYRTAQEALTNARKHAPGQPVTLNLEFGPEQLAVRVVNPLLPGQEGSPGGSGTGGDRSGTGEGGALSGAWTGYGLTGLRERAALGGGTLQAGPDEGEWRVCLRIPA